MHGLSRRELMVGAASTAALVGLGIGGLSLAQTTAYGQAPTTTAPPQEDEEGFDCTRHGNGVCGPVRVEVSHDPDGSRWVSVRDARERLVFGPVRAWPRAEG